MPISPGTKVTVLLIPAILFAIAGICALVEAFEDPPRARFARTVTWFSLSIVFLSIARLRHKRNQSEQGDSSNKSP